MSVQTKKYDEDFDKKLREKTCQDPFNGHYATEICRNCGHFYISPDGDTQTAKLVNACDKCWKEVYE